MKLTRWPTLALVTLVAVLPAAADEMQDAMARAEALNLMRQIAVQPSQAQQMIAPLERIQDLLDTDRRGQTELLNRMIQTLRSARAELIAGEGLSDQMATALDGYQQQREAARLALTQAIAEQMQLIARTLTDEQNRYLDWTPPGSIRPEERLQERLKLQRIAMGRAQEAAQMLDQVKHLDAFNFVTGRGPIINDYLALYFRPDAQQFQQAYQIVLNYTDQVRLLSEEQWQTQALDIGASLVGDLGLMPAIDTGPRPGTVSWDQLYRLMTNPQTLVIVRKLAE